MFALAAASLAFNAPSMRPAAVASVRMSAQVQSTPEMAKDSGATAPFGYFDPLGLSSGQPILQNNNVDAYNYFKEVEIKHGRVAMLAALGFIVGENFHPLFGGTIDTPSAFAFQQTPLQTFWFLVVAAIGTFETASSVQTLENPPDKPWTVKPDHIPGNVGLFGGAELARRNPAEFKKVQTKEINNGRLAMIGIAGMVAQELVTGSKLF
jgi:hypothetical protein